MPGSLLAGFLAYLVLLVDSLYAQLHGSTEHSHRHHRWAIALNNSADTSYYADILLGGQPFQVLVDTGSSDLWVAGNVLRSNDTARNASVSYAIGQVVGSIKTARLELGEYTINNQAFIQVAPSSRNPEGTGVLGLGPSSGSFILSSLPGPNGAPVLDRLLLQNTATPNFFTILLGRDEDPTSSFSGAITIGSALPQYQQILNEPKLPISLVKQSQSHNQHFQVQLDENGIIGPDGKSIQPTSMVTEEQGGRATAVLDCGFTLPQIPRTVADSIYGRFKDAEYTTIEGVGGVWVVPCEIEVNVTFVFGGQKYPMHPLDMTLDPKRFSLKNVTNSNGAPVCIGSFQPFTFDTGHRPTYDIVLGMSFMRNVYTLIDYGDFIIGANTSTKRDPYLQMHSITNASEAHQDFVQVRLGGIDTTGDQNLIDNPNNDNDNKTPAIYYVIATVVTVIIISVVVVCIIINRRNKKRAGRTG